MTIQNKHNHKTGRSVEEFETHGVHMVSNLGGFDVMISPCGDYAKLRDNYASDNPEITEWLEIQYLYNEYSEEYEPTIVHPDGLEIPLNLVTRI